MNTAVKKLPGKIMTLIVIAAIMLTGLGLGAPPGFAAGEVLTGVIINGTYYTDLNSLRTAGVVYPGLRSLSFAFGAGFTRSGDYSAYRVELRISDSANNNPMFGQNPSGSTVEFAPYQFSGANRTYPVEIVLVGINGSTETRLDSVLFNVQLGDLDNIPPRVETSSPASGAQSVLVDTALQITFSEALDAQSLRASNIYLTPGRAAALVLSGDGRTVTLRPGSNLAYNTKYTVVIPAGGLKDLAGNGVTAASWDFITVPDPNAAPVIESVQPASNAGNVAVSSNIMLNLSKALDMSSLTSDIITLKKGSTLIPITIIPVNLNGKGRVTLDPISDLENNVVYTVTVAGSKIKDLDGKYLGGTSWSFTTEAGVWRSTVRVTDKSPVADAANVPVDGEVTFRFSEAMYSSSINEDNIYIKRSGYSSAIDADVTYNSSARAVTIIPDSDLRYDTEYIVYVTSSVKDADRYGITPVSWRFRTQDEDYVRIVDRDPEPGEADFPVSRDIAIKFSRSMKSSSITTSNIYLRKTGYSTNVPASVSYSSSDRTATLSPDNALSGNTEYTVYVTGGVRDIDNYAVTAASWKFTTKSDPVKVIYLDPGYEESKVEVNKTVFLAFSKAMSASSLNSSSVYLKKYGSGSVISAAVSYNPASYTVTIDPAGPLEHNTRYTVYLSALVKDSGGDSITPVNWSFTTGEEPVRQGTSDRPLVKVDGQYLNFSDVNPVLKNGRVLIPFRALFEALNAEVGYDAKNPKQPKVTGKRGGNTVVLYIGKKVAYKNNLAITLDAAPEMLKGRVLIPLRFAGEALGAKVTWDKDTYTVIIETY